jgi:hypothetical protein
VDREGEPPVLICRDGDNEEVSVSIFVAFNLNVMLTFFNVSYTNLPPICEETLTHDKENVTKAVERRIGLDLPLKFGVLLDGWTHCSEHYLAVYACYEKRGVRCCPLLSMAPIINGPDDTLNAETHMAALAAFLPFFGKGHLNVICMVGDNGAVNKRLAILS